MKFANVRLSGLEKTGVVSDGEIILIDDLFADMRALVEAGDDGLAAVSAAVGAADRQHVPLEGADLAPPITRFTRDVLCTGWNYWDHFDEGKGRRDGQEVDRPTAPTFFTKSPGAIIGPVDDIAFDDRISKKWDYEAELALVIGRSGRSIPQRRAMDHVFGYCLANDISQRDLQRRHGGQWMRGKSADNSTPLGPFLVTPDEIDLSTLRVQCHLNGEEVQNACVAQMAFSIKEIIAELSFGMTLNSGEIVLTGTPAGVGNGRTPPLFLKAGDEVVTTGTGLGELRNRLVAEDMHGDSDISI